MSVKVQRLSRNFGSLILLLVVLPAPVGVLAQESVVPLQFSFSDPGARSMGFGGAFVALADDATAAFANPAGLVQLLKPEISIEGRRWSYSTRFTESGRVEGLPSGFGIDTTVGVKTATSENDLTGLSFLSFVYPKENWSLALYRHQSANFEFLGETQGLIGGGTDCCQVREFAQRSANDLELVSYGLAGAYRISDRLNLGLGVVYHDASFLSNTTLFGPDDDAIESILAAYSYLPVRAVINERIFFDDNDWTLTGGFLWRLSEGWSIGGVYRSAPRFDLGVELTAGPLNDAGLPAGAVLLEASAPLELPEIYGLGLAYRSPNGHVTVTFQWDHVTYSNIVDSLDLDDRTMDDVDELHLGIEYAFLDSTPVIAVRLGTWLEPDHQMRAVSDDPFVLAQLPPGDDELHFTAGLGVAMRNFQLDLGVDFAAGLDTVSLSAIYNF